MSFVTVFHVDLAINIEPVIYARKKPDVNELKIIRYFLIGVVLVATALYVPVTSSTLPIAVSIDQFLSSTSSTININKTLVVSPVVPTLRHTQAYLYKSVFVERFRIADPPTPSAAARPELVPLLQCQECPCGWVNNPRRSHTTIHRIKVTTVRK